MFVLGRLRLAHRLPTFRRESTCPISSMSPARFRPSRLDDIENVEEYRPGGFHPISIGDVFAEGRYRVVHKLGFGGSSTIWLARNHCEKLVTLKVMRADAAASSKSVDKIPELAVPRKLLDYIQAQGSIASVSSNIQTVEDHFIENGPNGPHLCLVYPLAGPSIVSVSDSPGRVSGSRRLRSDLARKVIKQVAGAVELMHGAGFVHGDLTTSNILFHIAEHVRNWSDTEVYLHFGEPETEDVVTIHHTPLGPHVPTHLVAPIDNAYLTNPTYLQEDTLLIDFGQSFEVSTSVSKVNYEPATVLHHQSPEARFERKIGLPSDIWGLACTIFEIRAGSLLFECFLGGDDEILKEIVATLGKLPEPWWSAFEDRHFWFNEDGKPKDPEFQQALLPAQMTSIKHQLASIGNQDEPPLMGSDGPMMERHGTRLDEGEIELLGDLLGKMLCYRPEDRSNIREVISHPWFALK